VSEDVQGFSSGWAYVLILLVALLTHGLLIVNDGVYWDGWLVYTSLLEKNWHNLRTLFDQAGLPLLAYVHWWMGYLPSFVFWYKLSAWVCIALSGILVYEIGRTSGLVGDVESALIALLSLSYPAMQASPELVIFPYILLYCLFLLGVYLAFRSEQGCAVARFSLRIASLLVFFVSFWINSLLVYYLGFLLLWLFHGWKVRGLATGHGLARWLLAHLDYVVWPFLFWIIKDAFFTPFGLYATYNRPDFSPVGYVRGAATFLVNAVYYPLNDMLHSMLGQPAVWLLIAWAAYWAYRALKIGSVRFFDVRARPGVLLAFGAASLGFGVLPYLAVGKAPTHHGWETRHSLLVGLPMAIVFLSAVRLTFSLGKARLSRLGWVFLTLLILGFGGSNIETYLSWQARWVKDRAIMQALSRMSQFDLISVFWIDDRFPAGGEPVYSFYDWSSIFKQAWGDEKHIGLDRGTESSLSLVNYRPYFTSGYNLADFDPAGCQAILTVRRGPEALSDWRLSLQYFLSKYFRPDRMPEFLAEVINVQIEPFSAPEAASCRN
jgi:hypothetical protein